MAPEDYNLRGRTEVPFNDSSLEGKMSKDALPIEEPGNPFLKRIRSYFSVKGIKKLVILNIILVVLIMLIGFTIYYATGGSGSGQGGKVNSQKASNYTVKTLPSKNINLTPSQQSQLNEEGNLTINGQVTANNTIVLTPTAAPGTPITGQLFYNQSIGAPEYYNGTTFVSLAPNSAPQITQAVTSIGGVSGAIGLGTGLLLNGSQLGVNIQAGNGITVNGSTISNSGVISLASGSPSVTVGQDGNGNYTLSVNSVVGSGTIGQIPIFTGAQSLGGSILSQSGGNLTAAGSLAVTGSLSSASLNVGSGNLTVDNSGNIFSAGNLTASGTIQGDTIEQNVSSTLTIGNSSAGNSVVINSGGRTFILPTTGGGAQTICTTGVTCASGGGQAVILQPGSAMTDPGNGSSIWINGTGGGNLIELLGSGTDKFVISNSGNTTIAGTLAVQGAGGLTVGVPGSVTGSINFSNGTNTNKIILQSLVPTGVGNATINFPVVAAGSSDTLCLATVANCTAIGNAGGDLTGTYPNPTIAKLQGKTLTISATPTTNSVLQYNGSAFVDGLITNANLQAGTFANITGTGALAAGSIASGFGVISTGNNITTTATAQGGIVNATTTLELNGVNINTAGTLNNVAYLNQANTFTAAGTALTVNNTASIGTLSVINSATFNSGLTVSANGVTITGNSTIAGTLGSLTGLTSSGAITFSGLSTAGIVTNTAAGVLGTVVSVPVANGGTGVATLAANGILYGNGTSAIQATAAAANSILATNGTNVPGLTQTLPTLVQGNITSTGALAAGSIASGFGVISTGNNITTTATIQGGSVTATGALSGNSLSINGTLAVSNTGVLSGATGITSSGTITFSGLGTGVVQATSGVLSVANVQLGTQTSGSYVSALFGTGGAFTINNATNSAGTITINKAKADASTLGIATFNATNFSDNGAGVINTAQNINSTATPTFGTLTLGLTGTTTGSIAFKGATGASGILTLQGPTTPNAGNFTLSIPAITANANVCTDNSICTGYAAGSGSAFIQGGNSFGATAILGTNDNNSLQIRTNGNTQATIAAGGATTFQNSANSTTAFQIQNQAGTSNLFIADTTNSKIGIGQVPNGAGNVLQVTGGINISTGGLSTSGTSRLDGSGNLTNIGNLTTTGSSTFTAGGANGFIFKPATDNSTAFQVQNAAGSKLVNVDTTTSNLISNPSFETNTTGWSPKGTGPPTLTRITSQQYIGNAALQIATTANTFNGATFQYNLASSTQYTFSVEAKASGSNFATFDLGWSNDGSSNSGCLAAQTVVTTGWTLFSCTFTAGTTTPGSSYVYVDASDAAARTFYIDAAQLTQTATASPYGEGHIALNGVVISPMSFQNTSDSTTAFQIQNAAGTSNLFIADTTNGRIGIGKVPTAALDVSGGGNFSGSLQTSGNFTLNSAALNNGFIAKGVTFPNGITANDVVVLNSSSQGIDTTTARDVRVYGVATLTLTPGLSGAVAISGNFQVTATSGAVAIGDQLVTSTTSGQVVTDNNATTGILGIALSSKSAGSSGLVSVYIHPVNGQYSPRFQNAANSTTAFQVQNAAGTSTVFNVDTQNQRIGIGTSAPTQTLTINQGTIADILGSPAAPTATPSASGGSIATGIYYYKVSALDALGGETILASSVESSATSVTGPSGSVALSWTAIIGAASYKVYRTTTSGTYTSPALVGSPTTNSFTDTLLTPNSGAGSTAHNAFQYKFTDSGLSYINGGNVGIGVASAPTATLQVGGLANSTTAFAVQNTAGTSALNVNTTAMTTTLQAGTANDTTTLGSNLITHTDFCNAAWTTTNWTLAPTCGSPPATSATHTTGNTSALSTNEVTPVNGTTYEVSYTISGPPTQGATLAVAFGGVTVANYAFAFGNTFTDSKIITATSNSGNLTFTPGSTFNGVVSAVTIQQVTQQPVAVLVVNNASGSANIQVTTSSSTTNDFIGLSVGQSNSTGIQNTALGTQAFQNNTTGSSNSALGYQALQSNTTGSNNTSVGYQALQVNTVAGSNTAVGYEALHLDTTGGGNTAVGAFALLNSTYGESNTAVGYNAGNALTNNANSNTSLGAFSLSVATNSFSNTAVGSSALARLSIASQDVALGINAGYPNNTNGTTTGIADTFLGSQTGQGQSLYQSSYSTALGFESTVNQNNAVILGCTNGINQCPATSTVGIGSQYAPDSLTVSPSTYGTNGTAGSTTTITESGSTGIITGSSSPATAFTSAMVGGTIYYSDGTTDTISAYTSATSLTATTPKAVAANSTYTIVYGGFNVSSTGTVGIGAAPTSGGSTLQVTGSISSTTNLSVGTGGSLTTLSQTALVIGGNQVCTASGCSGGGGSGSYINNGTSLQPANFNIQSSASTSVGAVIEGAVSQSADLLDLNNSSATKVAYVDASGDITTTANATVGGTLTGNGATVLKDSTNSTTAFQVQNASGTQLLSVDTSTTPNLLSNGSFEVNATGWAAKGSATIARDTTNAYEGNASLLITTTANANDGASYNVTLTPSTSYTLSVWYKTASSGNNLLVLGRQDISGTDVACASQTLYAGLWFRATCTFTTGATITSSNIFIQQSDATARTINIDAVQLQTGANATPYQNGLLQLDGVINSPVAIKTTQASVREFAVYNSSIGGNVVLVVDNANNRVGINQGLNVNPQNTFAVNVTSTTDTLAQEAIGTGATTNKGLMIQGVASQTADLLDLENSSGTVLSGFTAAGALQGGNGSGSNNATAPQNLVLAGGQGTGTGAGGNINFQIAQPGLTGSTNNALATVASLSGTNGAALFQNSANSTTAFQIQNAAAATILATDTTNNKLIVTGNLNLAQTSAPTAPTFNAFVSSGALTGTYYYVATYVTASGETNYGAVSASISPSTQNVTLNIPTGTAGLVTARKIYRGTVSTGPFNLVGTVNDNTTTTFTDSNTSPTTTAPVDNKTASLQVNGGSALTVGGGGSNTWVGLSAGVNNTTGTQNTALGNVALNQNTTGGHNSAVGYEALQNNTTGVDNSAVGNQALLNNTTGIDLAAVGSLALKSNTSGSNNVAVGYASLVNNTAANSNTALGYDALFSNTSIVATFGAITGGSSYTNGTYNGVTMTKVSGPMGTAPTANITVSGGAVTAVTLVSGGTDVDTTTVLSASAASIGGTGSGFQVPVATLTSGGQNTVLGYQAGYTGTSANANTTGNNNTFLGYNSGPGTTNQLQNATAIGTYATVNNGSSLVLGCANGVNGCAATTNIGIGVADVQSRLQIQSNPTAGTGTITTVGTAVTGSGTAFTTQAKVGDTIIASSQARRITAIASDTGLTIDTAFAVDLSSATAFTLTTPVHTVSATGAALFQNSTNSTTAFQIQNAAGTGNLFIADTTNSKIGIGQAPNSGGSQLQVLGAITAGANINTGSSFTVTGSLPSTIGYYGKAARTGSTINQYDVVIMNSSAQVTDTTTASDRQVYGVSNNTYTGSGVYSEIAISGNFTVNVNSGAVAIGDQLVTSTTAGQATVDNSATTGIIGIALSSKSAGSPGTVNIAIRPVGGQYSPRFQNASNSATAFQIQDSGGTAALVVSTNNVTTGANAANATLVVAKDSGTGRSINAAGTINASGTDYAEYIPWSGSIPDPGSVITYNGSVYVVSSQQTASFVGGDVFGSQNQESIMVAFSGQVPTKVTGSVNVGDLLVNNGDGTAKAVNPAQATVADYLGKIGIAEESSNDNGVKLIKAAIGTTSASVTVNPQQSSTNFADINVTGTATVNNLKVTGTATIAALHVTSSAQFDGDITIGGHIITAAGQPTSQVQTAAGTQATVTINGNDTTGTITITTGSDPTSGELAEILFSKTYGASPHIVLSPSNNNAAGLRFFKGSTTSTDFRFNVIDTPAPNTTYQYDYFIAQ